MSEEEGRASLVTQWHAWLSVEGGGKEKIGEGRGKMLILGIITVISRTNKRRDRREREGKNRGERS